MKVKTVQRDDGTVGTVCGQAHDVADGCLYGCLFSIPWQVEGFSQMQGCFIERQMVQGSPEVQDVALGGALCLEAVEEILAEVDRQGWLALGR